MQTRGALNEAEYVARYLRQKQELERREEEEREATRFEEVVDDQGDDDDDDLDLGDTSRVDQLLNSFAPK